MRRPTDCCGNCVFWKRVRPMQPGGVCRANPPTVTFMGFKPDEFNNPQPIIGNYWAGTSDTEWCGVHEHNEVRPARDVNLAHIEAKEIEGNA